MSSPASTQYTSASSSLAPSPVTAPSLLYPPSEPSSVPQSPTPTPDLKKTLSNSSMPIWAHLLNTNDPTLLMDYSPKRISSNISPRPLISPICITAATTTPFSIVFRDLSTLILQDLLLTFYENHQTTVPIQNIHNELLEITSSINRLTEQQEALAGSLSYLLLKHGIEQVLNPRSPSNSPLPISRQNLAQLSSPTPDIAIHVTQTTRTTAEAMTQTPPSQTAYRRTPFPQPTIRLPSSRPSPETTSPSTPPAPDTPLIRPQRIIRRVPVP
ncbi:hypothetical protein BD779DRAFT_1685554 [Infundibulicybe gibba]|nr:hypothetical protein BD779DRAFT_1685554 [Infundibulicybe gibba]